MKNWVNSLLLVILKMFKEFVAEEISLFEPATYNKSIKDVVDDSGRPVFTRKSIFERVFQCPRAAQIRFNIRNKTMDFHGKKVASVEGSCPDFFYDRPNDETNSLRCLCRGSMKINFGQCPLASAQTQFREDGYWEKKFPNTKGEPVVISIRNPQQKTYDSSNPRECGIEI